MRLSKSDRRGYTLILFIVCLIVGYRLLQNVGSTEDRAFAIDSTERSVIEHFQNETNHLHEGTFTNQKESRILFRFNPNTADSADLSKLGFSQLQISNIFKYRKKGGMWKSANDFKRLYGLSEEQYQAVAPYIVIPSPKKSQSPLPIMINSQPTKFKEVTLIDLNLADTTTLKKIPGIGSYYSKKICEYREKLGGYISVDQVNEIKGLPAEIDKWFYISDSAKIKKISINDASFREIIRHPYMNYERTKHIFEQIRKYGRISSWKELEGNHFTPHDTTLLYPYFKF